MSGAAGIMTAVLRVQVRMLVASELPALHRFNSSLLESYVEVSQRYLLLHHNMHSPSVYYLKVPGLPQGIHATAFTRE